MALLAGAAAEAAWLAPRGGGATALGKQAPRRWRRVIPTRSGRCLVRPDPDRRPSELAPGIACAAGSP
jgi:hypothetical protein